MNGKSLLRHIFILSYLPEILTKPFNKICITVIIHDSNLREITIKSGSTYASFIISLVLLLEYYRLESIEKIKKKYYDIIDRSFTTKLDLFLFSKCHSEKRINQFTFYDLKRFSITDELNELYIKAWSLENNEMLSKDGLTMLEVDNLIEDWLKRNLEFKNDLYEKYKLCFITDLFPYGEFEEFYGKDPSHRFCHYCHISDNDIEYLDKIGQIKTKRGRGYSMEIDRKNPNQEYLKDNIVLSCYWCNNAKTDEFSESEFIDHVGPGIRQIWEERRKRS